MMAFGKKLMVAIKQQREFWNFVTRYEQKFYQRGFGNVARADVAVRSGDFASAKTLLAGPLPDYEQGAADIIRCNMEQTDRVAWLAFLNRYLSQFSLGALQVAEAASLMDGFSADALPEVSGGPLVSVIMPCWNASATIGMAMRSILMQTWHNLELVVVDDASTDDTLAKVKYLAAQDTRITVLRLPQNAGPYVCKNFALYSGAVNGSYITGHDADDWAHPQRIERHMAAARAAGCLDTASMTYCLRMRSNGTFSRITEPRTVSPDGVAKLARISCLFERDLLLNRLGSWDCVRFGADNEMVGRTEVLLGQKVKRLWQVAMICLDSSNSLTGNIAHGTGGNKLTGIRQEYKIAYERWHAALAGDARMPFPPRTRPFACPNEMMAQPTVLAQMADRRNVR
jgi:Glycosyl transferase family 2